MAESNELKYKQLSDAADIPNIIPLHLESFQHHLIGILGHDFVEHYYRRILASPHGVIFICRDQERAVGFIAGLEKEEGVCDLKFYLLALKGFIINIFRNPEIIPSLAIYIKRMICCRDYKHKSELVSLSVSREYRRKGIGSTLVNMFEDFLKSRGVLEYKVFTETKHNTGQKLYDARGFSFIREFGVLGMNLKMYLKKLS